MKKYFGFTLAEVLITLAIIGLIAAMTLPNLIKNYQKYQTTVQLKKTYTDIMNIHKRAVADFGDPSLWTYPAKQNENQMKTFLETYYMPYLNGAKFYTESDFNSKFKHKIKNLNDRVTPTNNPGIILSDGRVWRFFSNGSYIWIYADINGLQKPNRVGKDVFILMQFGENDFQPRFYGKGALRISMLYQGKSIKEENAETNREGMGCSKANKYGFYAGWYCGALIQYDGWKIGDDYPW